MYSLRKHCTAINLLLALLNIRYIDYTLLLPIFKDRRISEYILCALTQLGSLSNLAIVLPILPRIDDKKNLKNLNKHNTFNIYILCFVCCYTNINPRFFEVCKCFLSSICSNSKNLFWWFCREWKCFCNDFFYSFLGCKIFNNYFFIV